MGVTMESLTAKRIKMLEKARELHWFTNVWSQDGKIILFDETINKVNVFNNWHFGDVTGQLWGKKQHVTGFIQRRLNYFLVSNALHETTKRTF